MHITFSSYSTCVCFLQNKNIYEMFVFSLRFVVVTPRLVQTAAVQVVHVAVQVAVTTKVR